MGVLEAGMPSVWLESLVFHNKMWMQLNLVVEFFKRTSPTHTSVKLDSISVLRNNIMLHNNTTAKIRSRGTCCGQYFRILGYNVVQMPTCAKLSN